MRAENVVQAMRGAVVGAALGTAVLAHQCIADDQHRKAPGETYIIDGNDGHEQCTVSPDGRSVVCGKLR